MKNIFNLPDYRLSQRAYYSLSKILENPDSPLPVIFRNYCELEGFYRLIKNKKISYSDIMNDNSNATIENLKDETDIVAIHDTTFVNPKFNLKSKELGRGGIGSHLTLAASADENPQVFGALNLSFIIRDKNGKKTIEESESNRWFKAVLDTENKLEKKVNCIHLMDREGDIYIQLSNMKQHNLKFVIRASNNRYIADTSYGRLFESLREEKSLLTLTCKISKREASRFSKQNQIHPPREARDIELSASSKQVKLIGSPKIKGSFPNSCEVNVVRVWENNPPKGCELIEWFLITSEKIETSIEIKRVIDLYRRRWLIEEFFKGLKTGCKIEEKQFQDLEEINSIIFTSNRTTFKFKINR